MLRFSVERFELPQYTLNSCDAYQALEVPQSPCLFHRTISSRSSLRQPTMKLHHESNFARSGSRRAACLDGYCSPAQPRIRRSTVYLHLGRCQCTPQNADDLNFSRYGDTGHASGAVSKQVADSPHFSCETCKLGETCRGAV